MTPAVELIRTLSLAGAKLRIEGDQLWVRAATGIITPELRAQITELKPQIIASLTTYPCRVQAGFCTAVFSEPGVTCFWCRKAMELWHLEAIAEDVVRTQAEQYPSAKTLKKRAKDAAKKAAKEAAA